MSDSDEKDQEKEHQSPSRPVTAAARRERRASTRPAGDADKARPAAKDGKDRPTPKRDRQEKQAAPLRRLVRFIREVWAELRKVIWPNRKQMITYTSVVLVFVVFMVTLVSGLDFAVKAIIDVVFGA